MPGENPLARVLFSRLVVAHDADRAHAALTAAGRHDPAVGNAPHAVRAALAVLLANPAVVMALRWPALRAAREALARSDEAIDLALREALAREPPDPTGTIRRELSDCGDDDERVRRSLGLAWSHHAPPAGRAAAVLIDVARAMPEPGPRTRVYAFLAARDVDVRGPLADDTVLPAPARLDVLCALAARRADRGALANPDWSGDPAAALCRALADWTRHATHPRQLLYACRKRDEIAFGAVLTRLAGRPLPLEVRAEVSLERNGAPREVPARALDAGRYECGRCGDRGLAATGRRALDDQDPAAGAELSFACGACGLQYFASWERATLDPARPPVPVAWLPD